MKLLSSSPSISSSSSSTISFDPINCTPKSATAGCLSRILRRMFCSRTLPTHPSDHITEANSVSDFNKQEQIDVVDSSKVVPGIIARLMGLDSLPELHPNSITRSRSINSVNSIHGKHRRVNSTLSVRDMPTYYFELENEEFFVLSFEKGSKKKAQRFEENKCRDKENRVEKPNEEIAKCREVNDLCLEKKGSKLRKKLQHSGTQNVEPAEFSSSEDSSPVSVLLFDQFIIDHDVPTDGNLKEDDPRETKVEVKKLELKKKDWQNEKKLEVYDTICRVIEAEVAKSIWLNSNNEEFEDVTADFGSKVLNQLLDELVIQLSGI